MMFRAIGKLLFRLRGNKTVFPIDTQTFNNIVHELTTSGWRKTSEYGGIDAWIDYGALTLRRQGQRLRFEWDNWDEGSIEGPESLLAPIAEKHALPIVDYWRWSVWDAKSPGSAEQVSTPTRNLSIAAYETCRHRLPAEDVDEIGQLIYQHDEWGIAIERLIDALLEDDIAVSEEEKRRILKAAESMNLERGQTSIRTL